MTTFNLIDEPWIPIYTKSGTVTEFGLRACLVDAHHHRRLAVEPPVAVAVLRVLLAVLHRVLDGPRTPTAWKAAWSAGRLSAGDVADYLDRWSPRFDLFDPAAPFFQAASHANTKPPTELLPAAASGHNATLFDHSRDDRPNPLPPGEAARWLVACQSFTRAGTFSGDGTGNVKTVQGLLANVQVFTVTGPTLFHTLLLNLPLYDPANELPFPTEGDDQPVWERTPAAGARIRSPAGWLDLLTYPARRIQLLADPGPPPLVTSVRVTDGDRPGPGWTSHTREIAVAYRASKTRGWKAIGLDAARDLWRDSEALLTASSAERQRPRVIDLVAQRVLEGDISDDTVLGLDATGLALARGGRYDYWRHQTLPLPARLLGRGALDDEIRAAVDLAERASWRLGVALAALHLERRAAPEEGQASSGERVRALDAFWAALPPAFDRFLVAVAQDDQDAFAAWIRALRGSLERTWRTASAELVVNERSMRRYANAERHYRRAVAELTALLRSADEPAS